MLKPLQVFGLSIHPRTKHVEPPNATAVHRDLFLAIYNNHYFSFLNDSFIGSSDVSAM